MTQRTKVRGRALSVMFSSRRGSVSADCCVRKISTVRVPHNSQIAEIWLDTQAELRRHLLLLAFALGSVFGQILAARQVTAHGHCRASNAQTLEHRVGDEFTQRAGRRQTTAIVKVDASAMRRKELTLFNVRRSNHETDEALALLGAHAAWFAPVLTHTRPLDRIDEAFTIASQYQDGVGKMTVKP